MSALPVGVLSLDREMIGIRSAARAFTLPTNSHSEL